ncbi:MAG: hypothetical protein QW303_06850 [Nitrososphaerota archaeon]
MTCELCNRCFSCNSLEELERIFLQHLECHPREEVLTLRDLTKKSIENQRGYEELLDALILLEYKEKTRGRKRHEEYS